MKPLGSGADRRLSWGVSQGGRCCAMAGDHQRFHRQPGEMPRRTADVRPSTGNLIGLAGTGLGRGVDQIPISQRPAAPGGGRSGDVSRRRPDWLQPRGRPISAACVRPTRSTWLANSMEPRLPTGMAVATSNPFQSPPTARVATSFVYKEGDGRADQAICQLGRRHLGPASNSTPDQDLRIPAPPRGTRVPTSSSGADQEG